MTCKQCKREIGFNEQFAIQDKTGARLCAECADQHWDVTTCDARGCSCSRGGNPMYCECREATGNA